MDRWLSNPPAITSMEIVAVATAAAFLLLTPMFLAFAEARRRRRIAAAERQKELDRYTVPSLATPIATEVESSFPLTPEGEGRVVPQWCGELGAEFFQGSRTNEFPPSGESEETSGVVLSGVPMGPLEVAPAGGSSGHSSEEGGAGSPERSDALAGTMMVSRTTSAPAVSVPAKPLTGRGWSIAAPVSRVEAFDSAVGPSEWSQRCELIEMRQARLPDWPPAFVRHAEDLRRLWEEGERLAAKFDRVISTADLAVPQQMQAAALAGVETDGRLYRLHFLLFEDLWPGAAAEARARAVFEVDPQSGPVRHWVEAG